MTSIAIIIPVSLLGFLLGGALGYLVDKRINQPVLESARAYEKQAERYRASARELLRATEAYSQVLKKEGVFAFTLRELEDAMADLGFEEDPIKDIQDELFRRNIEVEEERDQDGHP